MTPEEILQHMIGINARLTGEECWLIDGSKLQEHATQPRCAADRLSTFSPLSLISRPDESVAVIAVHGVMMKDPWYSDETSTVAIAEATRIAANDAAIESILFDINSPGGSSAYIDHLAEAVAYAADKKMVVAQSTGMIASGAYWLASGAAKIYAGAMDWVGSIGVRMDMLDASRYFANLGVERVAIDTGPLKSMGLFGTAITEEMRAHVQSLVDSTHGFFTAQVMKGRKMDAAQFKAVATGGVYASDVALRMGLIDGIQSFDKTLASMPRRKSSTAIRSKVMSDTNATLEVAAPKAATMKELKTAFPKSTAEWRETQIEADATLQAAAIAYANHLEAEIEKAATAKAAADKVEADKKAAADAAAALKPNVRGAKLAPKADANVADAAPDATTDFKAMAMEIMEKKKCRWAEACLEVKRRHPESLAFFGFPANGAK